MLFSGKPCQGRKEGRKGGTNEQADDHTNMRAKRTNGGGKKRSQCRCGPSPSLRPPKACCTRPAGKWCSQKVVRGGPRVRVHSLDPCAGLTAPAGGWGRPHPLPPPPPRLRRWWCQRCVVASSPGGGVSDGNAVDGHPRSAGVGGASSSMRAWGPVAAPV